MLQGLVMTLGFLGLPIVWAFKDPRSAFRVENLLMLGLTYWILLDLLQCAYDYSDVGRPAVLKALMAVGLFATGIWAGAIQRPWKVPSPLQRALRVELSAMNCFLVIIACASITLFRFAWPCRFDIVLMVKSLGGNREITWVRGALGGWESFIDHLPYFGYLLLPLRCYWPTNRNAG